MIEQEARQLLTQLRGADDSVKDLGQLVLRLAQEVDRLAAEMEQLKNPRA
jgi:hypothetical protein